MVFIFAILCDHGTRMFVKKIDFKLESLDPLKITDMDKPKTNETLKLQIMKHNIVSVQNT